MKKRLDEIRFALLIGRVPPDIWEGEVANTALVAAIVALGLRVGSALAARSEGAEMARKAEDHLVKRVLKIFRDDEQTKTD